MFCRSFKNGSTGTRECIALVEDLKSVRAVRTLRFIHDPEHFVNFGWRLHLFFEQVTATHWQGCCCRLQWRASNATKIWDLVSCISIDVCERGVRMKYKLISESG